MQGKPDSICQSQEGFLEEGAPEKDTRGNKMPMEHFLIKNMFWPVESFVHLTL